MTQKQRDQIFEHAQKQIEAGRVFARRTGGKRLFPVTGITGRLNEFAYIWIDMSREKLGSWQYSYAWETVHRVVTEAEKFLI